MRTESTLGPRCQRACLLAIVMLGGAAPALAQPGQLSRGSCGAVMPFKQVFAGTLRDFGRLRSGATLGIAALGGVAAFGAHSADASITRSIANPNPLNDAFKTGGIVGGTPFELGAAFGTYAIGRALGKPCAASVGAELIQAQLMAQALTIGVKEAARRARPEGSGFSFPSGHATIAFASATVLQRHFGWKIGVPAYAAATYVAASRVEMKRHYLSDVAFGAALGIVAGRAVTVGRAHRLMLTPIAPPDSTGAGVRFTWIGKK
jgi:membrane-associated phospholipid phosphatase